MLIKKNILCCSIRIRKKYCEYIVKTIDASGCHFKHVSIDQKRGLDIVEISALSPSPSEAALIANVYAQQYKMIKPRTE